MPFTKFCCRLIPAVFLISALAYGQAVLTGNSFTSSATPKTNYSTSIALMVGSGENTYLQFSLAGLPAGLNGSNISAANVVVYVDAVASSGTWDVYAVAGSWSASTITYNNAPALGSKILSKVPISTTGYVELNITPTVQSWLNGTLANNGIALVQTSGSSILASIDSLVNILTSHPAELDLVLVSAGPQGPAGPQGATGATGATGPAGPQGTAGPTGATGPQGPQGQTGATGSQGPVGSQGPAGPTGATGAQGPIGLTGATGATGAIGPVGPQGPAGLNNRGAWNGSNSYNPGDAVYDAGSYWLATAANSDSEPSPVNTNWQVLAAGLNNRGAWSASNSYNINDAVTDQGSFWLALVANNNSEPASGNSYWQQLATDGAAGLTGAQGPAGAQGPQGPSGALGPTGPAGPMGLVGPQGPAGPQGAPGTGASITVVPPVPLPISGMSGKVPYNGPFNPLLLTTPNQPGTASNLLATITVGPPLSGPSESNAAWSVSVLKNGVPTSIACETPMAIGGVACTDNTDTVAITSTDSLSVVFEMTAAPLTPPIYFIFSAGLSFTPSTGPAQPQSQPAVIVQGTLLYGNSNGVGVTLPSGTSFTSATSYACIVNDTTTAGQSVTAQPTSATSFLVIGSGVAATDLLSFVCTGY